ncbi:protein-export chaperone SecB [Endothiovibrio diazotrophicus]
MSEQPNAGAQFNIQNVYLKDVSFEAPGTPQVFREEWKPELQINLDTRQEKLAEGVFEVVLKVTATVKNSDKAAFLAEVHQAGIFSINGLSEEQLDHTLGVFCPNLLFPYAREVVSGLVTKGGFPQLLLAPVNFDALYAHRKQQQAKAN